MNNYIIINIFENYNIGGLFLKAFELSGIKIRDR